MTAQTLTLTDFLLARIAEDGDMARHVWPERYTDRMLAECEAKRRIVELHRDVDPCDAHDGATLEAVDCDTLRVLATPYADHADYREEWKP